MRCLRSPALQKITGTSLAAPQALTRRANRPAIRIRWVLDPPGCADHRNCNVNLDDPHWDRPDQDCELQQAPGIPRNLQLDETMDAAVTEVYGHGVVAMEAVNVVKPSGYSVGKGIWD
jgi:hypothetical protein